jgi:glycosyltransferase involved in cell wall biosynthesis
MIPAVSVVIATYNYGRFLSEALRSVLAQTFQNFEVIIIDDGSTDDTAHVAASFLGDPRIRYHRTERQGQPRAKNTGIRLTTGPLIAFLDADDVWLPGKLERQLALFAKNPELGVVYSRRLVMDEEGEQLRYTQPLLYRGYVLEQMFLDNFVCFSSAVVRRAVLAHVGLFDESIPMAIDYDLWLRVASCYHFDFVDEPLVRYRVGHANLSQRAEERLEIAAQIMRRFLDKPEKHGKLGSSLVRRAWAETYCSMALVRRPRSRLAAFPWYIRALAIAPSRRATWKELLSLPLPERVRCMVRRWLGRPADWSVRQRTGIL